MSGQPNYPYPPQGQSQGLGQGYPGYPPQQPGYPPQQPGYPPQQPGYPPQQPGYPPQNPQQPGYPPQQPGYQPYPPQQPGYPPQQPGYPPQPGYPAQQPGYNPYPGYPQPNHGNARFIVHAWKLFFNFPVEISVPQTAYIDTVVREACAKAQVPYNGVMGLKIKPGHSKKQLQKAELLPPNILVSQALQVHQKGPDAALVVQLDLMPSQGTQLTKSPRFAFFDYPNIDALRKNIRDIGIAIVGLANVEGGEIIIGVNNQLKIQGIQVNDLKHQQIHQMITQDLNALVKPSNFAQQFKVKVHPLIDANGQRTNLSGLVLEVAKWQKPEDLYSFDYVFYKKIGDNNVKVPPHELVQEFKQRKGKNKGIGAVFKQM